MSLEIAAPWMSDVYAVRARHIARRAAWEAKAAERVALPPAPAPAAVEPPAPIKPLLPPALPLGPLSGQFAEAHGLLRQMEDDGPPTIASIKRAVAREFRVSVIDIDSARRTAEIVCPRQIAMFLAKKWTCRSFPEIGRRFGKRDHTTVLHAWRKMTALAEWDPEVISRISAVEAALGCYA